MNHIRISIKEQLLQLFEKDTLSKSYSVITSQYGTGQKFNTFKTPLGKHQIYQKIGLNQAVNTVFKGRKPTGEIYTPKLADQFPDRDWILTRILWLEGLEPGFNSGGDVDTKNRMIYIHGMPDSKTTGSHGCINMRNEDIMSLFNLVSAGDQVEIIA